MRVLRVLGQITVLVFTLSNVANADEFATKSIAPSNAPVVLNHCSTSSADTSSIFVNSNFNIYNRSLRDLVDLSVEYRFYNIYSQQIGGMVFTYSLDDTLSAGDSRTLNGLINSQNFSEPRTSIARATCRTVGAHFARGLHWKPGLPWLGGPLAPMPTNDAAVEEAPEDRGGAMGPGKQNSGTEHTSALKFDVQRAWNDSAQDGLFVHDALVIHGGDTPMTIRPANFALTMTLANHSQKKYPALATGAPAYQKYNPLSGQYAQAFQIDPNSDLGRLGSIIVPAHVDVVVTVTFAIRDAVADASGNREVSFR